MANEEKKSQLSLLKKKHATWSCSANLEHFFHIYIIFLSTVQFHVETVKLHVRGFVTAENGRKMAEQGAAGFVYDKIW